jgi:hypothetical protein
MRHQTKNIALHVANTCNIIERSIRIRKRRDFALGGAIFVNDLLILFQFLERFSIAIIATFGVRNRNSECLMNIFRPQRTIFCFKVNIFADK